MKIKNKGISLNFELNYSTIDYFKKKTMCSFSRLSTGYIIKRIRTISQKMSVDITIDRIITPNGYGDVILEINVTNINDATIMYHYIRKELQKFQEKIRKLNEEQFTILNKSGNQKDYNSLLETIVEENNIEKNYKKLNKSLNKNNDCSIKIKKNKI